MTDGILLSAIRRFEAAAFLADARRFRVTVAFLSVDDVMSELLVVRSGGSAKLLHEHTPMRLQVESSSRHLLDALARRDRR